MTCEELINIASHIGLGLLESGAEAYRVETSVHHVVEAYDLGDCEVFSIPNYLHIHLTKKDGTTISDMSRASSMKGVDLERLNALNDLCRFIAQHKPDSTEIWKQLHEIDNGRNYSLPMQMLSYAICSAGFAMFWGGVLLDAAAAAIIGGIIGAAMFAMGRLEANLFYKSLISSALSALLACIFIHFGLGINRDEIIIGVFMTLLPGLLLTNFMREIIVGDWLTGITKLMEALLIAAAVALGTGLVLAIV